MAELSSSVCLRMLEYLNVFPCVCVQVLDLVEVFLTKQGSSALVLGMVEPLLSVIENGMSSESGQQEVDFLRRAADIFRSVIVWAPVLVINQLS